MGRYLGAMLRYPLARREGSSVFFSAGLGQRQIVIASLTALIGALVLMNWFGLVLLGLAWVSLTLIARLAVARIGGLTGDVYGAICEITETILLIAVVMLPARLPLS